MEASAPYIDSLECCLRIGRNLSEKMKTDKIKLQTLIRSGVSSSDPSVLGLTATITKDHRDLIMLAQLANEFNAKN